MTRGRTLADVNNGRSRDGATGRCGRRYEQCRDPLVKCTESSFVRVTGMTFVVKKSAMYKRRRLSRANPYV